MVRPLHLKEEESGLASGLEMRLKDIQVAPTKQAVAGLAYLNCCLSIKFQLLYAHECPCPPPLLLPFQNN